MKHLFTALLITALAAPAGAESFGAWSASIATDGSLIAATSNDAGDVLGQSCDRNSGNCYWLLAIRSPCTASGSYTALSNSESGTAQLRLLCLSQSAAGQYRYIFEDFAAIDHIVKTDTRVGFALALQNGHFKAVRFDLTGSRLAIDHMRRQASESAPPPTKPAGVEFF